MTNCQSVTWKAWQLNHAGYKSAPAFIFAHGAGAPMDSDFMVQMAGMLASKGINVYRFEFPYMMTRRKLGGRRPPDRMPVLLEAWRQQVKNLRAALPPQTKIVIGGKSMGGRVASLIADALAADALVCLGYPFHPQGKPDKLRTQHLYTLKTPTLIVQGTRDSLGNEEEIKSYHLPASINFVWLKDGNHDFKPRVRSGFTHQQHLAAAATAVTTFIKG